MIRVLVALSLLASSSYAAGYEPTSSYKPRRMEGFNVLVSKSLAQHPEDAEAGLGELEKQLAEINRLVPPKPLAELQRVRIWVDWETNPDGGCVFHPSREYLQEHDMNPDKAGCVEVSHLRHFVDWSRRTQPCMILHEMAHAYHFRVLGEHHRGIDSAFKHAMDAGLYDSVDYILSGKKPAYARTDAKEYFAEITEAYFSKNDFYPFTREELKAHDPDGFQALRRIWGEPRGSAPPGARD